MKAVGNFIVITKHKEEVVKTSGGLELTEAQKDDVRYRKATVVSPGMLVKAVEEDDVILYDKHAGNGIELNNEFYHVIQERDVVLVL